MIGAFKPGDDVWVEFEENEWPGVVERVENSGYIRCRVHFHDPVWDFGRASARVMPEQTVAVRQSRVRPRAHVEEISA